MTSHTKTIKDARTACSHVMDDGANLAVINSKEELAVICGEVSYHDISYKSFHHRGHIKNYFQIYKTDKKHFPEKTLQSIIFYFWYALNYSIVISLGQV